MKIIKIITLLITKSVIACSAFFTWIMLTKPYHENLNGKLLVLLPLPFMIFTIILIDEWINNLLKPLDDENN